MNERIGWVQEYLPWVYAIALSLWGGAVHVAQRLKNGEVLRGVDFVVDVLVCSFAGSIAFFVCQWQGLEGWPSAIVISLSAHSGPRALALYMDMHDRFLRGVRG